MNNTTDDLTLRSLAIIQANLIPNSLLIAFGTVGMLFALITFFVIGRGKEMRSRYYSNCLHICAANLCCCTTLGCIGLKRVMVYSLGVGEVSKIYRCALDIGAIVYFTDLCLTQNFCLAFDRLISLSFPLFYVDIYERLGQLVNIFFWVFMFIWTTLFCIYGLNEGKEVPVCTKNFVFNEWMQNTEENLLITFATFSVAINIGVVIIARHKNQNVNGLAASAKRKRENRLLKMMSFVVLCDLIIWVSGDQIFSRIFATFSDTTAARSYPYLLIIYCLPPIMNFVFYVSADTKFRDALSNSSTVSFISHYSSSVVSSHV